MSDCFVGEIRMFAASYAPQGWHLCDGTLMPVMENQVLFALIGTTYGGDGVTKFALPDLRGRLPMGMGQGVGMTPRTIGQRLGTESVAVSANELPSHTHPALASTNVATADKPAPTRAVAATPSGYVGYLPTTAADNVVRTFDPTTIGSSGGSGSHSNMMPTLAINYIIALSGVYPTHD